MGLMGFSCIMGGSLFGVGVVGLILDIHYVFAIVSIVLK